MQGHHELPSARSSRLWVEGLCRFGAVPYHTLQNGPVRSSNSFTPRAKNAYGSAVVWTGVVLLLGSGPRSTRAVIEYMLLVLVLVGALRLETLRPTGSPGPFSLESSSSPTFSSRLLLNFSLSCHRQLLNCENEPRRLGEEQSPSDPVSSFPS